MRWLEQGDFGGHFDLLINLVRISRVNGWVLEVEVADPSPR